MAPSGSAPGAGTRPWRLASSVSPHSNPASALLLTVQPGKGKKPTKPHRTLIKKFRRRAVRLESLGTEPERSVGSDGGGDGVPSRQQGATLARRG